MKQILMVAIFVFGVGAQTWDADSQICSLDAPYPVYEFSKVLRAFLLSIPQVHCANVLVEKIVQFNCVSSGDEQFRTINFTDRAAISTLNNKLKYGFIAHGFLGDCYSDWPLEMMRVWADSEPINVCCVDWSRWAKCNYITDSQEYVFRVGDYIARIINNLITEHAVDINDIILVGHSFGGIIVGIAGKHFEDPQLPLCIALDPAGFAYSKPVLVEPDRRLAATDCKVVKALYTDEKGLGSPLPLGSVNIAANGGDNQPQCVHYRTFPCSHFAATTFFIESIRKDRISNYTITSDDGTITDIFTIYANDIPGSYNMITGKCYPFFLDTQPPVEPVGGPSLSICQNCIFINDSILI